MRCQRIILNYYQEVARQQNERCPRAFAEKTLPASDLRPGIRYLLPNVKEIVVGRRRRNLSAAQLKVFTTALEGFGYEIG